jgi:hypothetical protein
MFGMFGIGPMELLCLLTLGVGAVLVVVLLVLRKKD